MGAAIQRDTLAGPDGALHDGLSVLIVDDDPELAESMSSAFKRTGAQTIVALDPSTARSRFTLDRPDVVVLDLHLGAWSGFDVLREFRASSDVPIVVLTARDSDDDRMRGLSMGADDYLSKPFDERELVARALGRLQKRGASAPPVSPRIIAGGLALDATTHTVTRGGTPLNLTVTEFRLLHHLMARAGQVVSTSDLLREIWEQTDRQDPDVLRVTLHRLRRKLGDSAASPVLVQTVPGVGIIFRPPVEVASAPDLEVPSAELAETQITADDRPRNIGSVELAEPDAIRVKLVTDPQLEALLFALPGAALEAFDEDQFAATWRFPVAAPGAREVVEYAGSAGLTIAMNVDEILPALATAKRPRPRRAPLTNGSTPTTESAFAMDAVMPAPISAGRLPDADAPTAVTRFEPTADAPQAPSIAERLSAGADALVAETAKTAEAAARKAVAALPRATGPAALPLSRVSGGGRVTALLLLVSAFVAFLSIGSQLAELTLLARVAGGAQVTASELVVSGSRQQAIAVALLAAYAATGLRFLAWLHGRYAQLRATRRTLYSPPWVVVSFFVPIANLYVPYRAIVELFRSHDAKGEPERSHLVIDLWWAAWLAFLAASVATSFAIDRSTLAQLANQARLNIVADLMGIVAAIFAAVVVIRLDAQLHQDLPSPGRDARAAVSQA